MQAALPADIARYLTFEVDAQLYAVPAGDVAEVIRVPAMARVPQAPEALLGVANLRGNVLPLASLRVMLGGSAAAETDGRAIVLNVGAPAAIVVRDVTALEAVDRSQIQAVEDGTTDAAGAFLGAFATGDARRVARILDIRKLLDAAFTRRARARPVRTLHAATSTARRRTAGAADTEVLLTFDVAGQEFALPLAVVQEIIPAPAEITRVADAEAAVLGIISVRDRLLPLLSLRTLLGITAPVASGESQKVVVLQVGGSRVGLVADRARAIVAAEQGLVDPVPPILAARTGGESRIRAVYRGAGGQRLISILAPDQLFRDEVMQRLTDRHAPAAAEPAGPDAASQGERIYLVFRLAGDEFGLPIDTVVEVAQVPAQITRVPRTPKFLEGVVNLRGEVLPIVDQRRRFDMPPAGPEQARRLVVVRTERHRAGVIVDAVSDVLRTRADRIEPPPELTDATARLLSGVLNVEGSQRIVLLLDPAELLTRAEQGLLDSFQARQKADA